MWSQHFDRENCAIETIVLLMLAWRHNWQFTIPYLFDEEIYTMLKLTVCDKIYTKLIEELTFYFRVSVIQTVNVYLVDWWWIQQQQQQQINTNNVEHLMSLFSM